MAPERLLPDRGPRGRRRSGPAEGKRQAHRQWGRRGREEVDPEPPAAGGQGPERWAMYRHELPPRAGGEPRDAADRRLRLRCAGWNRVPPPVRQRTVSGRRAESRASSGARTSPADPMPSRTVAVPHGRPARSLWVDPCPRGRRAAGHSRLRCHLRCSIRGAERTSRREQVATLRPGVAWAAGDRAVSVVRSIRSRGILAA